MFFSKSGGKASFELSQSIKPKGVCTSMVEIIARNPCPEHLYTHWDGRNELGTFDNRLCMGGLVGRDVHASSWLGMSRWEMMQAAILGQRLSSIFEFRMRRTNQFVQAWALLGQQALNSGIAGASTSITDVSNTAQTVNANPAGIATPVVVAGVTSTAVAFTDHALGDGTTNTDYHTTSAYCHAATIAGITSNTTTFSGVITNSSAADITYKEAGHAIACQNSAAVVKYFLCHHDLVNAGTGYLVSHPSGTLTVNYTDTWT